MISFVKERFILQVTFCTIAIAWLSKKRVWMPSLGCLQPCPVTHRWKPTSSKNWKTIHSHNYSNCSPQLANACKASWKEELMQQWFHLFQSLLALKLRNSKLQEGNKKDSGLFTGTLLCLVDVQGYTNTHWINILCSSPEVDEERVFKVLHDLQLF